MEGDFTRFPIEKYKISEPLGQGGFGSVISYIIMQKEDPLPDIVAVKIFQQKHASNLHREKDIMEALAVNRHPNIVKYFGICQALGQQPLVQGVRKFLPQLCQALASTYVVTMKYPFNHVIHTRREFF